MTGELYQIEVGVKAPLVNSQIFMTAALDTCAGCNLVRANQVPEGAILRTMKRPPAISSAQGQQVDVLGIVTLMIQVRGVGVSVPMEFLVVKKLVVHAVLGTPWIDQNVLSISPRQRTVLVQLREDMEPVEVKLHSQKINTDMAVRAAVNCVVPAFSESWMTVCTNRQGLSVLGPTRHRDRLVHVKNAVVNVPGSGQPFRVLVENLMTIHSESLRDKLWASRRPRRCSQYVLLQKRSRKRMKTIGPNRFCRRSVI